MQVLIEQVKDWRGCLMLSVPLPLASTIRMLAGNLIPTRDLIEKEDYVHVTVLYGFPQSFHLPKIEKYLKGIGPIKIELGEIKRFSADENRPDSDVLYVEVISKELRELHTLLKDKFDVKTSYPTYNPHITIAYVKPGSCQHIKGSMLLGLEQECYSLVYSRGPSDDREQIELSTFTKWRQQS